MDFGDRHIGLSNREKMIECAPQLKNWRRIATRYDKMATSFLAFIMIASAKLWMPFLHDA